MASLKGLLRLWHQSRERSHPYRYFIYHVLRHFNLTHYLTVRYQGCRFRLYPNPVSGQIWYNYEDWHGTHDIRFLKQFLRPGEQFIDVGANVGTHSICLAKHLGSSSVVHAFEPHPRTYERLLANIALNKLQNIRAHNTALGEEERIVEFSDFSSDDLNRVQAGNLQIETKLKVPQKRLDSFDFGDTPISVLKVDVEGYELFVFRGSERLLPKISCLYFEVAEEHFRTFDYTIYELLHFLESQGWHIQRAYGSRARI